MMAVATDGIEYKRLSLEHKNQPVLNHQLEKLVGIDKTKLGGLALRSTTKHVNDVKEILRIHDSEVVTIQ